MKINALIVILLFSIFSMNAQSIFQHGYGNNRNERCQSAFSTHDGGFLLNGATTSFGGGDVDALIIKTDAQGNIQWSQSCGTASNEIPYFATETYDNKFVFIGTTDALPGSTINNVLLFKTDSIGNFLWAKSFGGLNHETGLNIIELPDHGYGLIGTTESYGAGSADIYFIRTDVNGDTLFTKVYGTVDNEKGTSFSTTTDGGFIICGKSSSMISGTLVYKAILMRIDSSGNQVWTKLFGDTLFQEAQSVAQTNDGGYIVCGSRDFTASGNYDILLFKTDSMGNIQWSKTYGGNKGDASYTVNLNTDGKYVLSGYTNSMGYGHAFKFAHENGFVNNELTREIINNTNYQLGNDSTNIFLMKTDASGDTIWTRTYGDSLQEEAFLSHITSDGGYMLSGFSDYHNADSSQMLIIKTDSLGFSGCYEFTSHPIIVSNLLVESNITYSQASGMDVTTLMLPTTNRIISDSTYCLLTTGVKNISYLNSVKLFPNPTSGKLFIVGISSDWLHTNRSNKNSISIFNLLGEKSNVTFSLDKVRNEIELNVSTLQPGMYLVEIRTEKDKIVRKFIKE